MHFKLGSFDLDVISDGDWWMDGGTIFGVVPRVLWQELAAPDELNRIRLGLNSLLVRTGRHTVLIEAGMGSKLDAKFKQHHNFGEGKLLDEMAALGVTPDDVDAVILSHLHFDHAGWCTVREGDGYRPTFPNATYIVQQREWDAATRPNSQTRAGYHREDFDALPRSDQLKLIEGDVEVTGGITCQLTGGHSDGHQSVLVESEGRVACFCGDIYCTTWHTRPNYITAYDLYPAETFRLKQDLLAEAEEEGWILVWVHETGVPAGTIRKDGKRYAAVPLETS